MKKIVMSLLLLTVTQVASAASKDRIISILNRGGSVTIDAGDFSRWDILEIIGAGHERVTTDCRRVDYYACNEYTLEGSRILIGQPHDYYTVNSIIISAKVKSYVSVIAEGYDDYALRNFASDGATVLY